MSMGPSKKGTKGSKMAQTVSRKKEHVDICLSKEVEASYNYWDDIHIVHHALPELDKDEIDTSVQVFGKRLRAPIIIAAMTGGYPEAKKINENLARAAAEMGLGLGVGSQRSALEDGKHSGTFEVVKEYDVPLVLANLGAPQAKDAEVELGRRAMEMIEADLLCIHLNFTQEIVQPEGDTDARGVLDGIGRWARELPIIAKETGAGMSREVVRSLVGVGVKGIDVGGLGGTSWSAVEVHRARKKGLKHLEELGNTFWDWGIPTPVSVVEAVNEASGLPIIATGGIRDGLDVARSLMLGASCAGLARPLLGPAVKGFDELMRALGTLVSGLKAAMFLAGAGNIDALRHKRRVLTGPTVKWLEQLR
jgi:isopentenyl-diphosphate delta-isomerase